MFDITVVRFPVQPSISADRGSSIYID